MLIQPSSRPPLATDPTVSWRSNQHHTIGWKGNVFLPGCLAGEASVDRMLDRLGREPLGAVLATLRGVYGLFIYDHAAGKWLVAADNTGLYRIYYTTAAVATSFLELAGSDPESHRHVDDEAILEFIAMGANFGRHTPVATIKKLRRQEILELDPSATPAVRLLEKPLEPFRGDADAYVLGYFKDLAHALSAKKVSVDITGGFDSRVIACLLDRSGLPFESALFSANETSNEAVSARAVAATLGRPLHFHVHDISTLEDDLYDVFLAGDGLTEIPRLHRDRQLCLRRLARGVDLMVHGGGGEFFRDHYYVQDFPRYGSHRVDIAKFYRLRVVPIRLPATQLTGKAAGLLPEIEARTIARFEDCRQATNNATYDRIFLDYRVPEFYGPTFSNYMNMGLEVEAPFLDFGVATAAIQLSPWSRFFMLWHRRMLTAQCPKLAELRTAEGYTASSRPGRLLTELGTYVRVQAGRVGRKLSERYLGKVLFHRVGEIEADAPGYREALRHSSLFASALARLQRQGIIAEQIEIGKIANPHVGRIITMGTLLNHLESRRHQAA